MFFHVSKKGFSVSTCKKVKGHHLSYFTLGLLSGWNENLYGKV